VHADGTVTYAPMLFDEIGAIPVPTEVYRLSFDPNVMSAGEAVRQAVREFIDTTPLPTGTPRDSNWRAPIGRGGIQTSADAAAEAFTSRDAPSFP
jgi:hypothetical protein